MADLGLIGLAVMGQNLALNIESRGYSVSVYNRTSSKTKRFIEERGEGRALQGYDGIEEFVSSLEEPRKVFLMVKAGAAVDETLHKLMGCLAPGDIIIDGGNSHFLDTRRRSKMLSEKGLRFLGVGISGGEEGALNGPSIMPGGDREAYEELEEILLSIAAKADGEPCCAYLGRDGAGHFVKMVHNGIEYADMELIAEAYALLHDILGLDNEEIAATFDGWGEGPLSSYLMEITADLLGKRDHESGKYLVDLIVDEAEQKGTGRWTVLSALELGIAVPTIAAALQARVLSSLRMERQRASQALPVARQGEPGDVKDFVEGLHSALYASKICAYAQGMALLQGASREYSWNLDLSAIARLWRAGCIIRARFLDDVSHAYSKNPGLDNLFLDDFFKQEILSNEPKWRSIVARATIQSSPALALSSALSYFDAYRCARLPANIIQAQRDYFGAHTYQRIDKEGHFHSDWSSL